jgi:Helix-turn-helix domain
VDERPLLFPRLEALSAIRDDRELGKHAKLVAFVLLSHVDAEGTCFPGLETLAAECGLSRGAVCNALSALVARGPKAAFAVVREHRGRTDGARGRSSNLYHLGVQLNPQHELKRGLHTPGGPKSADLNPPQRVFEYTAPPHLKPPRGVEALQRSTPKKHTDPSKRSQSKSETADPRVNDLWAHFHVEHERLRGVPPVFSDQQRGAVGKAWKSMLKVLSLDDAKAVVSRALSEPYHLSPWAIMANLNRYRGTQPARGRAKPIQEGVADPEAAQDWGKKNKFAKEVGT